MKLGIMGGTFDPIHVGHLRAAECAREALGLDEVAFVPAGVPPHRREPLSSALDRFAMVSLGTAEQPGFVASDVEIRREGPSYTVDTLEALKRRRPEDALVLVVGSDTLHEIKTWKDAGRLLSLCTLAVVVRPGIPEPEDAALAPDPKGVVRVEGPGLPISATAIREKVRQGRSIRYLVPGAVADYIAKRGLYR